MGVTAGCVWLGAGQSFHRKRKSVGVGLLGRHSEGDGLELSVVGSGCCGLLEDELVMSHSLTWWTGQLLLDESVGLHRRVGCREGDV